MKHPEWSKNANIYEVNIRQYTLEGTFKAFQKHLPRLQGMGVKILWLMPVFPVGRKNRKGRLGSYYAVKDYKKVNPNFGTLQDLKDLVEDAHQRGMKVILDWVANHTAWDHRWTQEHPDWYVKDENGNFKQPNEDWPDVIKLNYANPAMRRGMIEALKYWLYETDIDGYRCDVADLVPTDFWNAARSELDRIKPVFMLAESDHPDLHEQAFDMSYDFKLYYLMNQIASGQSDPGMIDGHILHEQNTYKPNDYRMAFTTNHDENSWDGTVYERLGKSVKVMAVLAATLHGMPLIYGGQEAGLNKRLAFFEKDVISWEAFPLADFYTTLLKLKKEHKALWNGEWGGSVHKIKTDKPQHVYAYRRLKEDDEIMVILNFRDEAQEVALQGIDVNAGFNNVFTDKNVNITHGTVSIKAYDYIILARKTS